MDLQRSKGAIHNGLKELLQKPVEASKLEKAEKKRQLQSDLCIKARSCNREFFLRLRAQMAHGCGIDIAKFLPQQRIGLLAKNEVREFRAYDDPIAGRPRRRSIIINTDTDVERLEVRNQIVGNVRLNPTWHKVADMGTVGRPACTWWLWKAGERGSLLWDRCHRIMCDCDEGEMEAGATLTKLSWNAVLRLRVQPFGKGSSDPLVSMFR